MDSPVCSDAMTKTIDPLWRSLAWPARPQLGMAPPGFVQGLGDRLAALQGYRATGVVDHLESMTAVQQNRALLRVNAVADRCFQECISDFGFTKYEPARVSTSGTRH